MNTPDGKSTVLVYGTNMAGYRTIYALGKLGYKTIFASAPALLIEIQRKKVGLGKF